LALGELPPPPEELLLLPPVDPDGLPPPELPPVGEGGGGTCLTALFAVLFAVFVTWSITGPTGAGTPVTDGTGPPPCCVTFGTVTEVLPTETLAVEVEPPTETCTGPAFTEAPGSVRASAAAGPQTGTATQAVAISAPRTRARPWRI
jgi:hypothetical protein